MTIGEMEYRILIQQKNAGVDTIGQPSETWATFATVWADVRFIKGLEVVRAGQEVNQAKASFRVRRRTDITEAMRVVYAGENYNITAILPQSKAIMDLVVERI